jgi:putative heme-binding domain-containing protein
VGAPIDFLEAAFAAADPAAKTDFVGHLARVVAAKNDPALAALFVTALARQPAATDALKQSALESLARALPATARPAWSPGLQSAFSALLKSPRPGLPGAALPLIARWGGDTALADELKPVVAQLTRALGDTALGDADRGQVAANLLGVRQLDPAILPAVAGLLGSEAPPALQRRVIEALGAVNDPAAGRALVAAFAKTPAELHDLAFGTIVKRPDWSGLLVQALADQQVTPRDLGPANLHRLRTHADKAVAARANQVIDELKGPEQKEKDALIAQFIHEVEKPGSAARGRELFTANCAGCHKFNGEGADFAPDLTGMGAHGAHDLLIHILDPNRVVEPNFIAASIETKDDLTYDGIILRENNAVVVVRNQTAETEIRKDNIRTRQSTGRSLMPEGYEALGADGLRDLLTYLAGDDLRFRILNLAPVFNGSSAEGIYANRENRGETVRLRKFGTLKVEGTPFDVISPQKSPTGMNLLTLRGRMGLAPQYPQRVEVPAGVAANRLHFLSGIGGWAYPWDGENQKDKPVLKATVHFAGGGTEELVFRNGVEFADYIGSGDNFNVPGSKYVPDLVRSGQVRWFARDLKRRDGVIEKVVLESFDNEIAPTIVGITAEQAAGPATLLGAAPAAPERAAVAPVNWGAGVKALLIGGGTHHDYQRFFNLADVALLNAAGRITAAYREPQDLTAEIVRGADVLVISANKAFPDPAVRAAVMAHAEAGKGLVLLHPGLWYNWADWPEYNRVLAGGGSRGHDKYGEFEVATTGAAHPVLKDVPAKFSITDELYWQETDPAGTPIEVLATAHSQQKGRAYPQVFVVKHPKARIAGITLGHDGAAHSHPAYQQLLKNAVAWAAGPAGFTSAAQ